MGVVGHGQLRRAPILAPSEVCFEALRGWSLGDGDWNGGEVAELDEFGFQLFEECLVFVGGVCDQFAEEFGFLAERRGICIWWDGREVIGSV